MRNKRLIVFAALLCAALATTGIALAVTSGGVSGVSATFDATNVVRGIQKQCTVTGGDTYTYTRAVYKGAAVSSDARLNGPIRLVVQSMVDNTTGIGAMLGTFAVNNGAGNPGMSGRVEAALSAGQLSGMARGHVANPGGALFAGVNGGFSAGGGFTGVSIGAGSAADSASVISPGACVRTIYLVP
jgi:hypothetical protein